MSCKRYIVSVYINLLGENHKYSAIVDDDRYEEFNLFCDNLANENFRDYNGFDEMMANLFPDHDWEKEFTEEELEVGYTEEPNYYWFDIDEFVGDESEWDYYDCIWDDSK